MKDKETEFIAPQHISETTSREYLASEALSYIPKIIELLDRNPFSKTYGCFDRSFWHYRTADFPSGMYQEYVLPLAYVYQYSFPNNIYYRQERIREWVIAGMEFAAKSAHPDGSCDDYYPFERALGAAAFALYAASESYLLMGLDEPIILEFLKKRARWIMNHGETGKLSNHHALVGLCLQNLFLITGDKTFQKAAQEKIKKLLSWQSKEGWFPEYEGCDPGYLSICIDFLAKYYQKSQDQDLIEPLERAVRFMGHFMHPDGSYGGEYGSRNTFHYFPHGMEIVGELIPDALMLNNAYLEGAGNGKRAFTDDDRIFGHLVYNLFQAYLDYKVKRPAKTTLFQGIAYFPESGFYVRGERKRYWVINLKKGGVFKYFENGVLTASDTGVVLEEEPNKILVSHIIAKQKIRVDQDEVSVSGSFYYRPDLQLTGFKFVLFRIFLLTFGRISRNLVRFLLQKKIILSKKKAKAKFKRTFHFSESFSLIDFVELKNLKTLISRIAAGSDMTSIYVATSQPYQASSLKPWTFFSEDKIRTLNADRKVEMERAWP